MTRRVARALGAAGLLAAMLAASAVPVAADPSAPVPLIFSFTECHGPVGTPDQFDAFKQPGGGAALHLTDGRGIFVAVEAIDLSSGAVLFSTPGFEHNGLPTITCHLVHPVTKLAEVVVGMLAAAR